MSNPFHEAVQPGERITKTVAPQKPFFHEAIRADELRQKAARMSRQEMFNAGVIGVEDLDDDELRIGRCRLSNGRLPTPSQVPEKMPTDIYEAMCAEHLKRSDEKLRQQLDSAMNTMVEIMEDDTVEPRDRFEAAKYLFERIKGKTPDRVQVQTNDNKAPWEEVFTSVAKITRERSNALQEGAIDAEVVEDFVPGAGEDGVPERPGDGQAGRFGEPGVGQSPMAPTGFGPMPGGTGYSAPAPNGVQGWAGVRPTAEPKSHDSPTGPGVGGPGVSPDDGTNPVAESWVAPTHSMQVPHQRAPSHDAPATNDPVVTVSNAERIRTAQAEAAALAERRKAQKDKVQAAKKRRIVKRNLGIDHIQRVAQKSAGSPLSATQSRLAEGLDE